MMSERRLLRAGWGLWAIFAIVICVIAVAVPKRSLIPLYSEASFQFWAGIVPQQEFLTGYYYLPASQILFSPFAFAGFHAGGLLWRALTFVLMSAAVWQWACILVPARAALAAACTLPLLIAGAAGVLRIGQFDGPMWSLMLLAAAQIALGHAWWAALALALAFALKPTAIVAVLLFGAVWPRLGLRMAPMIAAVLAAPFLVADPDFVWRLYVSLADRVGGAVQSEGWWNNLATMLNAFGLPIPYPVMTGLRVVAAVATLALAIVARRRLPEQLAAFTVFALAAIYLLLFNPRTEAIGYVGLALVTAPLASRLWLAENKPRAAIVLGVLSVIIGLSGLTYATMRLLDPWFRPALALATLCVVVIPRSIQKSCWATPDRT